MVPGRDLGSDLVDQDDRIARDHADERQHAEHCNETHRLLRQQQCRNHADESERRHAQHQQHALEALQLEHQNGQD